MRFDNFGLEPSQLVRYRFDTLFQLRKHVHAANPDRRYLFLRDPGPQFATGARIVLDVSFRAQPHRCVLHGLVRWREHGSRAATWLELPKARVHHRRFAGPCRRRRARRLPADLMAEVRPDHADPFVCRVLDVGEHGARVFTPVNEFGAGPLGMTLLPSDRRVPIVDALARVVWSRAHEVGIEIAAHEDLSHRALIGALEQAWRHAASLTHPPSCRCSEGGLPDELLAGPEAHRAP